MFRVPRWKSMMILCPSTFSTQHWLHILALHLLRIVEFHLLHPTNHGADSWILHWGCPISRGNQDQGARWGSVFVVFLTAKSGVLRCQSNQRIPGYLIWTSGQTWHQSDWELALRKRWPWRSWNLFCTVRLEVQAHKAHILHSYVCVCVWLVAASYRATPGIVQGSSLSFLFFFNFDTVVQQRYIHILTSVHIFHGG